MTTKEQVKDPEVAIEAAIDKTENFILDNGRTLITILAVLVVLVGGYFAYRQLYQAPRVDKASAMMFAAQQRFALGDYSAALNGDGANAGFANVIERYGSTPQGNLAHHYSGICHLRTGDMDAAMAEFGKYKPVKGAPGAIVNARNFGLMGDIHSQRKEYDKAADLYARAVEAGDNILTAPAYLRKLGMVLVETGKPAEAVAALQRIRDSYPESMEARDVEKLIGQFEQK